MARPRVADPRNKQLKLYFTQSEIASVKRRAEALGMRPVHFGRAAVLADNKMVVEGRDANGTSRRILTQLARLGNNLNQMVRHLHATGDPLPSDLEPLLADIRGILAREFQR